MDILSFFEEKKNCYYISGRIEEWKRLKSKFRTKRLRGGNYKLGHVVVTLGTKRNPVSLSPVIKFTKSESRPSEPHNRDQPKTETRHTRSGKDTGVRSLT